MITKFKADKEQILKLISLAVTRSMPVGMGHLHFKPGMITPEDCEPYFDSTTIHVDYFQGRMVKLTIHRKADIWWIRGVPSEDYQSWCGKYETYRDLCEAAGIADVEVTED